MYNQFMMHGQENNKNVLLFKFRCNIFIGVRIIKEMQGSVASGTHCTLPVLFAFTLTVSHTAKEAM